MKRILLLFIALAAVWGAAAKIRLPEIIGNDMVLQQNFQMYLIHDTADDTHVLINV